MPVGAAIGGALGAAGSIGGALLGSSASKSASAAQQALGQQALTQQQGMWSQALGAIQPVLNLGTNAAGGALSTLQKLLTPGPSMTATLSQIPGFQFAQDWGQKAVQNIGSTTGLGGNTLTAGANFATGLAQQGYGNIVNSLNQLFSSGIGGAASAANSLGGTASNFGQQIGSTLTGIGQSQAQGILGSANALSSGLQGAAGSAGNALLLSRLLGGGANAGAGIYTGGSNTVGAGGGGLPSSGILGQSVG
jgi:hypothetical protein